MTKHRLALPSGQRGFFTLIGLLLALVIIVILLSMYGLPGGTGGPGGTGSSGDAVTIVGGTKNRAQDTVCRNNLAQLRAAIGIQVGTTGVNPPSLDGLNAGVDLACPGSGEPYEYDPSTGQVHCVHPGHESF
jgi:hypothetical protein